MNLVQRLACVGLFAVGCGSDATDLSKPDSQTAPSTSTRGAGPDGADASQDAWDNRGDVEGGSASDPLCDMNGVWVGRQVTESVAAGLKQFASNWYYFEARQDGDEVTITRHVDCGVEVRGKFSLVQIEPATMKALMEHNVQTGRKGTLKREKPETCDFSMERYWSVRGADEAKYVPSPRNSPQSIAEIATSNPLPTPNSPDGAEDWDGDGRLGVAWKVVNLNAARNSVQRDWTRYFSDPVHPFPASPDFPKDIVLRAEFSNEEQVLHPSSGLITTPAAPSHTAKHTLTLRFLGRGRSDARAKAILRLGRFDTCLAIQAALPAADKL